MYDDLDCAGLTKRVHDKMEKGANEKLAGIGITFAQMQMLMLLYHMTDKAVPLKTLERHFEVAQSTAAGLIVRLERKGLVASFTSPEDKRLKIVQLTPKGIEICISSENEAKEGERLLLSGLNADERIQFHNLLTKVNNNLK